MKARGWLVLVICVAVFALCVRYGRKWWIARRAALALTGAAVVTGAGLAGGTSDEMKAAPDEFDDLDDLVEGGARAVDIALRPTWFDKLRSGEKTVDGRLARGAVKDVQEGDIVLVRRSRAAEDKTEYPDPRRFPMKVRFKHTYPSFTAMLETEGIQTVLPGVSTVAKGVEHYRAFCTADDEKAVGVVALGLEKVPDDTVPTPPRGTAGPRREQAVEKPKKARAAKPAADGAEKPKRASRKKAT
jgi:ASC-1-like (ASCH) protein